MARAAVEGLAFDDTKKEYVINVLDPLLESMVQELLSSTPPKPIDFMIEWLNVRSDSSTPRRQPEQSLEAKNKQLKKELGTMKSFVQEVGEMVVNSNKADTEQPEPESEEDDDEDVELAPPPPKSMKARQSVSAEAYGNWNVKAAFDPPKFQKTPEQTEKLRGILNASFMFSALDAKEMDVVLLAVEEKQFEPGSRIIKQGDDGDCLYIIEEGSPECKILIDGEEKVVKKCVPGDVFGELALLYNSPRAASVDATDKCTVWRLDQHSFNHIVKEAASKRTSLYEDFLKKVRIFFSLDDYQRSQISDALKPATFKKDDYITKQGENGDNFYILEEGSLVALKSDEGGEEKEVMQYGVGDYFGELAMLKDQPRAASVKVTSDKAKVLCMQRKAFKHMLGPLQDILQKNTDQYA
mmetsp:Transcript_50817/g.91323  ORF Transcript_50817/g.91323 Transcript_50817/m.91323 type:complete len:411 (-) Transcript_50817:178-1410(-)|eukprot:CAMPEP_0197653270 /NCGR_PEP_ID=MMETSP1338-20131121/34950_1 /TAXON_ID=43686 ORGANISM="Pelagodinium beii, Strain RCC1491" /NCGR_SAMPLE_ID=MMETSP1338 /ASSEMBLY_ACC=CAM_ASM_000754 /LENGTH=410 /DNA_ID=CAMNT_0043228311 /DNA_START=44 /DNA_END=1276 /DNA_ORIENTATION=+